MNIKVKTSDLIQKAWSIRYTDINECLKIALKLEKRGVNNNDERALAWSLLLKAIGCFLLSKEENYLDLLLKAKSWFDNHTKDFGNPVCQYFIGNVYESLGDYNQALQFVHNGIKAAENIEFDEGKSDALSVAGIIYSRLGDQTSAIKNFKECLSIRGKLRNYKAMASTLNLIARSYSLMGDYKNSLNHYKKSLSLRVRYNDIGGLPWTYLGMASLMEKFEHVKESQKHYQKGLLINKHSEDKRFELHCLLGLGRLAIKSEQIKEAEEYLKTAEKIALTLNAKPLLFEIYQALSDLSELKNCHEEALIWYKKFHLLKEEVNNADTLKRIHNQQMTFAVEKAQKETEIYQLRNVELKAAFEEIAEKNKDLRDSINYAFLIQKSILPTHESVKDIFPNSFIFWRPRDIVSGDFYFIEKKNEYVIFAAVDCTGHGVPGAMMSVAGYNFLSQAVKEKGLINPSDILHFLDKRINERFRQSKGNSGVKDGMDIALCTLNISTNELQFAGAMNPIYLISKGELKEIKGDYLPIGNFSQNPNDRYNNHIVQLIKGDDIYLFSDGFADQFGGPNNKKFKYSQMKELFTRNHNKSIETKFKNLTTTFEEWKGNTFQIDDVLVFHICLL